MDCGFDRSQPRSSAAFAQPRISAADDLERKLLHRIIDESDEPQRASSGRQAEHVVRLGS